MTKRRIKLAFALAILAALCLAALNQSTLIGWWRGEGKYKGRYTNSWRAELRSYKLVGVPVRPGPGERPTDPWWFIREPTQWELWLNRYLPASHRFKIDSCPPLQDGDPEAVSVLIELLQAPETNVRILAANGLKAVGSPAGRAVPLLLTLLKDEDGEVVEATKEALSAIDPTTAKRIGLSVPYLFDDW